MLQNVQGAAAPNVVLIVGDDIGYADVGFMQEAMIPQPAERLPEVKTPNLDSLARQGIIFSNGHVTGNVCSPTRAGLMLGRYQQRVAVYNAGEGGSGMRTYADVGGTPTPINPLFPAWLKQPGDGVPDYVCGIFGKWHLGLDEVYASSALSTTQPTVYSIGGADGYGLPLNGPLADSTPGTGSPWHPLNRGFDVSFNFMDRGAHDYWDPNDIYSGLQRSGGLPTRTNPNGDIAEPTTAWDQDYYIHPERVPANYLTRRIADAACAFIQAQATNNSAPFFCYVPFNAAHSPAQAPYHMTGTGLLERLGHTNGTRYANVDDNGWFAPTFDDNVWFPDPIYIYRQYPQMEIPSYLGTPADPDTIRRERAITLAMGRWLDKGVGRIVQTLKDQGVYDNTIIIFFSDNGGASAMKASNKPLRKCKQSNHEGGIRVPFFFSWPAYLNRLPPGKQGGRVIDAMVSSLDVLPTVMAAAGITNHLAAPPGWNYAFDGSNLLPLIEGAVTNVHHKLYWSDGATGGGAVATEQWKLYIDRTQYSLFNIAQEVGETTDLAAQHPDLVRSLRQDYYAWMLEVAASAGESPRLWTTVSPAPTPGYQGLMVENFNYAVGNNLSAATGGTNWPSGWAAAVPGSGAVAAGNLTLLDPNGNYVDDSGSSNQLQVQRTDIECSRAISGSPVSSPVWLSCLVANMFDNTANGIPTQHVDEIRWDLRINNDSSDYLRVGQGATAAGRTRFVANGADVELDRSITLSNQTYLVVMNLRTDTAGSNDTVKVWIIGQGTALGDRTEAALNAATGGGPNLTLTNLDLWSGGIASLGLRGSAVNNNRPAKFDALRLIYGLPTDGEMIAAVLSGTAPPPNISVDLRPGFVSTQLHPAPGFSDRVVLEYDLKTGWFPNGVQIFSSGSLPAAAWNQVTPIAPPIQVDRWLDMETHRAEFPIDPSPGAGFFRVGYSP